MSRAGARVRAPPDDAGHDRREPEGVFRSVERPVYGQLMANRIEVGKGNGEGEFESLLGSGDTRTIS